MIDNLEGLLLAAAEGDPAATNTLASAVRKAGAKLPAPQRNQLADSLKLVLANPESRADDPSYQDLALTLAENQFDGPVMRTALAAAIRRKAADFADPGRLIRALGIQSDQVPMTTILARWAAVQRYEHKAVCWHDEYGLGSMREIDPLGDLVSVSFKNIQRFTFDRAVASLQVAEPGSLAHTLVLRPPPNFDPTGHKPNSRKERPAEVIKTVAASFSPPLSDPKSVMQTILVPKIMTLKAFDDWTSGSKKKSGGPGGRAWDESRSLEELKEALKTDDLLDVGPGSPDTIAKILKFSYQKEPSAQLFADCTSRMWLLSEDPSWLETLIPEYAEAVVWQDSELFRAVTCKVPAKQIAPWLTLARVARGHDWLVKQIVNLPLRHWDAAESVFDNAEESIQDLFDLAVRKLKKGAATADTAMWLWRQDTDYVHQLFANPRAIFRVLAKDAKGDYLKAHRDLRKLLMDDKHFQSVLMGGGDEEAIANFVRTVKAMPLLQAGEQQSLLVKVVRLFPDAKEIVEERRKVVEKQPLPRISSLRSVELKRQELEDITKKQIPENSRAIGHARSYGDLRENFEFKAAKERQRYLMARKADLEAGLGEVSPTDFSEVVVGKVVVPGCSVTVEIEGADETFHLLGLWDSAPEERVLSFEAPMGIALVGKKIGAEFTTPQGKTATIKNIAALPEAIVQKWVNLPE